MQLWDLCVSAQEGGKLNGQIANTVCQVTSEPAAVSVCVNKQNLTHDFIAKSRAFSVSVLGEETPMQFIGLFGFKSGRDGNKFEGVTYRLGRHRPLLSSITPSVTLTVNSWAAWMPVRTPYSWAGS